MDDVNSTTKGFDWGSAIGGVLTTGGNIFSSTQQRKAQEIQAKALRDKGLSDVEVAKLMLEAKKYELEALKNKSGAGTGNKTLYIGLGVGAVIIVATVIFAVTRKT